MMIFLGILFVLFVLLLPAILQHWYRDNPRAVYSLEILEPLYYLILKILAAVIVFVSILNALWK